MKADFAVSAQMILMELSMLDRGQQDVSSAKNYTSKCFHS